MTAPDIREVPLDELVFDDSVQCRVQTHHGPTVEHYAELMRDGVTLPPLKAVESASGALIVYDGFQRGGATRQAGIASVQVEVTGPGEVDDARWLATSANGDHGLPLTRADRRSMCRVVLLHPEGAGLSDRQIARRIGTTNKTVASVRRELVSGEEIPHLTRRRGADGKMYPTASRSFETEPQPTGDDPEPLLPFDLTRHAESPEEPDNSPVSPPTDGAAGTQAVAHNGEHDALCATCGAEPCDCRPVATPDGDPDPNVPPEVEDDSPPWEGGPADAECERLDDVVAEAPAGLTEDGPRKAWRCLREYIQPVLDGIDEHRRSFASLVERPLLDARAAITGDTVTADFARARRVFAGVVTDAHDALEALDKLRHAIEHMMPHEVCRECGGARCGHCQLRGFLFAAEARQRGQAR